MKQWTITCFLFLLIPNLDAFTLKKQVQYPLTKFKSTYLTFDNQWYYFNNQSFQSFRFQGHNLNITNFEYLNTISLHNSACAFEPKYNEIKVFGNKIFFYNVRCGVAIYEVDSKGTIRLVQHLWEESSNVSIFNPVLEITDRFIVFSRAHAKMHLLDLYEWNPVQGATKFVSSIQFKLDPIPRLHPLSGYDNMISLNNGRHFLDVADPKSPRIFCISMQGRLTRVYDFIFAFGSSALTTFKDLGGFEFKRVDRKDVALDSDIYSEMIDNKTITLVKDQYNEHRLVPTIVDTNGSISLDTEQSIDGEHIATAIYATTDGRYQTTDKESFHRFYSLEVDNTIVEHNPLIVTPAPSLMADGLLFSFKQNRIYIHPATSKNLVSQEYFTLTGTATSLAHHSSGLIVLYHEDGQSKIAKYDVSKRHTPLLLLEVSIAPSYGYDLHVIADILFLCQNGQSKYCKSPYDITTFKSIDFPYPSYELLGHTHDAFSIFILYKGGRIYTFDADISNGLQTISGAHLQKGSFFYEGYYYTPLSFAPTRWFGKFKRDLNTFRMVDEFQLDTYQSLSALFKVLPYQDKFYLLLGNLVKIYDQETFMLLDTQVLDGNISDQYPPQIEGNLIFTPNPKDLTTIYSIE